MTRVLLVLLLVAAAARADGKFVSTQVPVVEIPDQRAIIVFKDGRERLVIDTAYAGGEGDLAWIVPLPAPPKIEPVSPAVFRTLETVTMPNLMQGPSAGWRFALLILVLVAGMAAIPARLARARVAVLVMGILLIGLFGFVMLIPKGAVEAVTVLGRTEAGHYETATLEARDAGELLSWLGENGFRVSPDVREGVEAYLADGWVFAVARLRAEEPGARPHPLSFEFATEEPVYPLKLTGKQDRQLSLRIFVLADKRARSDVLATESCYSIGPAKRFGHRLRQKDEQRQIGQPELLALADGTSVLTTLAGELDPDDMRRDLVVRFDEFAPLVPLKFSPSAALASAAGTALWLALLLLAPCYVAVWLIAKRRARVPRRDLLRSRVEHVGLRGKLATWGAALGLGLLAGAADYATTEVVALRGDGDGALDTLSLYDHHFLVSQEIAETDPVEKAREIAAREWKGLMNPYDGLPVREEWSPGNYGFEIVEGKVCYVHYDARGTASTHH